MTKIKLCGLKRECEIKWANELKPDYIGFVFGETSRRYVSPMEAGKLKAMLHSSIKAVGVFVDANPEMIVEMAKQKIIDVVQLHGSEDEVYLQALKKCIKLPIFQAFRITSAEDIKKAEKSSADMVLLDAGAGCGDAFDWTLLKHMKRPYFLAGGLTWENVPQAVKDLHPYGVDTSSSLETEGLKDGEKMEAFVKAVRREEGSAFRKTV